MEVNIEVIEPLDDDRWIDFVENHPDSCLFHSPEWLGLLSDAYGYKPYACASIDSAGNVRAGAPFLEVSGPLGGRRWVCLPFSDYCPPLCSDGGDLQYIIGYLRDMRERRGLKAIEIRSSVPPMDDIYFDDGFVMHKLYLDHDPDVVFRKFRKKGVRYEIRKAIRNGIEVHRCHSMRDLSFFYELQVGTRRRLGVPVQPRRFIELLWDRFIQTERGFVLIARKGLHPVAGAVFLQYGSTVTYKYSASDYDYVRMGSNDLVLWKAIEWACLNKYDMFDFGKTRTRNTGLRSFKNGWGAEERPLRYSFVARSSPSNLNGLPVRIGNVLIKHTPAFVCRGIGRAFYKYFA